MKRIFVYMMLVAAAFSVQSCLHDDDEVFSESAAVRMQKSVSETKALLESSPAGWVMHYYAGEEYTGVGCTFLMRFQNGKAYVSGDIAPVDMVSSSDYDVVTDQGPVLTFNTYNEIFHYLAQPMQKPVDGMQGDFEFVVMKTEADKIYLTGKKWGNKMVLERLPEGTDWEAYLTDAVAFDNNMVYTYAMQVGGQTKGRVALDFDNHRAVFSTETEAEEAPYSLLRDGFVVPNPIRMAGKELTSFRAVEGTDMLKCTNAGGEDVTFVPVFEPVNVLRYIGKSAISMNDDAAVFTYTIPHGEQYTYTSDVDWIKVEYADNMLTLNVLANNDGRARTGNLIISNSNGETIVSLTQFDFDKDILGDYYMAYYNSDGQLDVTPAVIGRTESGEIAMRFLLGGRVVMSTALQWDDKTSTLTWMSGQHLGVYGNWQVFNIYYTDDYWSSISQDIPLTASFAYDVAMGGTYADFVGSIEGQEINAVYLMACSQAPLTSTGDFLGYLEIMQYPTLMKMDAVEENEQQEARLKSLMQAKRLARPMAKVRQKRIR